MKPSSALILEQDGIVLLQRSKGGWRAIGRAEPGAEDLDQQMQYLRRTAMDLSGGQFATKLVIPNSQILYQEFAIADGDRADRGAAVREALEGLTPYPVDEVAFDWHEAGGGNVRVAVVAEETLVEAEAFAERHRFNPLSFVAIPEPGEFAGEPYFGEASVAHRLLNPGGRVEPDAEAIDIAAVSTGLDIPRPGEARATDLKAAAPDDGPAPDQSDQQAGAIEFVSRHMATARASGPPEPLNLKWVTPRLSARQIDRDDDTDRPDSVTAGTILPDSPPRRALRAEPPGEMRPPAPPIPAPPVTAPPKPAAPVAADQRGLLGAAPPVQPAQAAPLLGPGARPAGLLLAIGLAVAVGLSVLLGYVFLGERGNKVEISEPGARIADPANAVPDLPGMAEPQAEIDPLPADPQPGPAMTAQDELAALSDIPPDLPEIAPRMAGPGSGDDLAALPSTGLPEPLDAPRSALPIQSISPAPRTGLSFGELAAPPLRPPLAAIDPAGFMADAPAEPGQPTGDRIDGLYLASIDPVILGHDAVALPPLSGALPDQGIDAPGTPPAPGQTFEFDENGLVRATPEGSLTPEGALVVAGRPPLLPLARPGSNAVLAPSGLSPERRQELANLRPMPRPGGLQETGERDQLAGLSRSELATFKPLPRPRSIEAAAQQPSEPSGPTEQAVTASFRPVARPSNLARAVNNALREATAAATPSPVVQAPVPSGAGVAQAATIQNGLRLNTINLIGVYGTASNRRALVRLSGGRFVMVTTGDRLDGGQVTAISEDALVYVKNGRNVRLDVPNG